jgi:LAS superfamily LD-carboxypeptidase LdcB
VVPPASKIPSVPGTQFDQAAFQKAQTASMIGKLISSTEGTKNNPLFSAGLVSTKTPDPSEYTKAAPTVAAVTTEAHVVPGARNSTFYPAGSNLTKLKGAVDFGEKKVASWIAPILQYAKQHGWTGDVESGYRSLAEQTHIYDSGVRPAAKPGTSNHEFTTFPGGAVDVTNASQLSDVLSKSPYAKVLVWAGSKDPVHFSHPHNGSY